MNTNRENPNYYSIIPATVRYCKDLSAQEKILYSEITALTNVKGYCWATNNYFAELYGLSKDRISRQISNLAKHGFIHVQMIYVEGTKQIQQRRIYLTNLDIREVIKDENNTPDTPVGIFTDTPIGENDDTPVGIFTNTPIGENNKDNTTRGNTINNNNKKLKGKVCKKSKSTSTSESSENFTKTEPVDNLTNDNDNDFIPDKQSNNSSEHNAPVYDYNTYKEIIHKNISYDHFKKHKEIMDIRLVDELVECMLDVITTQGKNIKINSELKDRQVVINRYLSLHVSDIQHIIMKFQQQQQKITHVKSYLKTLLYTVKLESNFYTDNYLREQGLLSNFFAY